MYPGPRSTEDQRNRSRLDACEHNVKALKSQRSAARNAEASRAAQVGIISQDRFAPEIAFAAAPALGSAPFRRPSVLPGSATGSDPQSEYEPVRCSSENGHLNQQTPIGPALHSDLDGSAADPGCAVDPVCGAGLLCAVDP